MKKLFLLMLLFCIVLTGCTAGGDSDYSEAVRLFGEGDYAGAEVFFIKAIEEGKKDPVKRLGHAYNLIGLGKKEAALEELEGIKDSFEDEATLTAVRKTIIDILLENGDYLKAAEGYEELAQLSTDVRESSDCLIQAAVIKADMYREKGMTDELETELRNLISLKTFADSEYYELYSIVSARERKESRLRLADEIVAYMNGHSSYISDYRQLVSVVFDAAKTAEYTEWTKSGEDYYVIAEELIARAEGGENGLTEDEVLKYKVIIAERRGKMEVAYKLLGVYLNHCPDDAYAQKEMDYLQNRLGLGQ